MSPDELDYDLPEHLIARYPLAERDASRLLVVRRDSGSFQHQAFLDLPGLLQHGDLLVRNVSRVLPARLAARRASGGRVELLLYRRHTEDCWQALARPAGRLRSGEILTLASGRQLVVAREADATAPGVVWLRGEAIDAEMAASGTMPLPPYLGRAAEPIDAERYQTVWARKAGSAAAPTAGLHFSQRVLEDLGRRGIELADLVLHVGPGTFLPIRSERVEEHAMHVEEFEVPPATVRAVEQARGSGHRVVAIGTTVVRALESAVLPGNGLAAGKGETRLLLLPGSPFRTIDGLLTNFHQPRSTLLALVAAFAGLDLMRAAYREAVRSGYRFLSYGDAMLVL